MVTKWSKIFKMVNDSKIQSNNVKKMSRTVKYSQKRSIRYVCHTFPDHHHKSFQLRHIRQPLCGGPRQEERVLLACHPCPHFPGGALTHRGPARLFSSYHLSHSSPPSSLQPALLTIPKQSHIPDPRTP